MTGDAGFPKAQTHAGTTSHRRQDKSRLLVLPAATGHAFGIEAERELNIGDAFEGEGEDDSVVVRAAAIVAHGEAERSHPAREVAMYFVELAFEDAGFELVSIAE